MSKYDEIFKDMPMAYRQFGRPYVLYRLMAICYAIAVLAIVYLAVSHFFPSFALFLWFIPIAGLAGGIMAFHDLSDQRWNFLKCSKILHEYISLSVVPDGNCPLCGCHLSEEDRCGMKSNVKRIDKFCDSLWRLLWLERRQMVLYRLTFWLLLADVCKLCGKTHVGPDAKRRLKKRFEDEGISLRNWWVQDYW